MKKSIWIFLISVLLPAIVLGWLALRSAEEQQIVYERRTAELYQKETETLAATVREAVDSERRSFGDVVHRLLAKGDAKALARDFTNTLTDAWPRKSVGFVIGADGRMLSPASVGVSSNLSQRRFLLANSSFLTGTEASQVYYVAPETLQKGVAYQGRSKAGNSSQNSTLGNSDGFNSSQQPTASAQGMIAPQGAKESALQVANDKAPGRSIAQKAEEKAVASGAFRDAKSDAIKPPAPAAPPSAKSAMPAKPAAAAAPMPAPGPAPAPVVMTKKKDAEASEIAPVSRAKSGDADSADAPYSISTADKAKGTRAQESKPITAAAEPVPVDEPFSSGNALISRQVEPQQQALAPAPNWSTVIPATADFRALTQDSEEGMVSRFVEDKLDLIFWLRPPEAPEMVFGCLVEAAELHPLWLPLFRDSDSSNPRSVQETTRPPFILALLDDKARPVAMQSGFEKARDWKHPFVASEIGEVLPHWEATLYLASPTALADTARGLRRIITFAIVGAVALIALGGWLVVADARRQLALAQQKTDFVSNVSHELKTPLTSIRMFAEIMHDRPQPAEKQGQYLRIITVEAERLTRLINNVLDFAKSERKQRRFDKKPFDLHDTIARIWEGQEIHLHSAGFTTRWEAAPPPYRVLGDEDAIAQVLVNLLSNAEKYSPERKEVELHTWVEKNTIYVSVLDRGMGVPAGEERKIFEAFYRAHDSLSSGIQGSGLGLTLAQRVAAEHGGTLTAERREGGGSRFTLRLPLAENETTFA